MRHGCAKSADPVLCRPAIPLNQGSSSEHCTRPRAAPAAEISTEAHPSLKEIDRPANLTPENAPGWGSDVIADALRDLKVPYIALNPGASYRGIHDLIVNYLGNETPQMILRLHEEVAVSIAHGYAKVTGKAMAAAVHSNVGLMHATMAIFNAWCDRMPVVIVGATGPVDAAQAPSLDRLDPHRPRPGRPHPRLHQMGRPAGVAGRLRARRSTAATGSPTPRPRVRSTSISTPSCRN